MNKKNVILMVLMLIFVGFLFAEKSLERLGNEAEFAADEFYGAKDYVNAAFKYEEALDKFEAASEQDGISVQEKIVRILDKIFKAYYFAENYEKAIGILQTQLATDPKNSKKARTISQIYEKKLKDVDKAIETLVLFDSISRKYVVEKKIASLFTDKSDFEKALFWYQKTYELKQDAKVIKNIASLYLKLGKKAEAIGAYEDFIKTNPNERVLTKTYKNMGALYEDMNNTSKAIEYYEKSNELDYNESITLLLISKYYDLEWYTKALKKIELLLQNNPDNADAIYYRAMIKYSRGEFVAAKADFKIILSNVKYSSSANGFIEAIESAE